MIRSTLAMATLLVIGFSPAACLADLRSGAPEHSAEACEPANNCRTQLARIRLRSSDGKENAIVLIPAPYVSNGAIEMFPGEALVFRFENMSEQGPGLPTFVEVTVANPIVAVPPSNAIVQSTPSTKSEHDSKTGENYTIISKGSSYAPTVPTKDRLKDEPPGTMIVSFYQLDGKPDMVLRIDHNLPKPLKFDTQILRLAADNPPMEKTSTCPIPVAVAGVETWPYPITVITLANFIFVDMSGGFNCT